MINYVPTHQSAADMSLAMFISEDNDANTYTLMNEEGYEFTASQRDWISFEELQHDSLMESMYEDLTDSDPMGYESDSYIAYLNRH